MKVIIISGISGSGKTMFLRALEDAGFFCVDNFPLVLLESFLDICEKADEKIEKAAFVVDIREREFLKRGPEIFENIGKKHNVEIIFLESSDETIIKRFKETRRTHPLYGISSIREAIAKEREMTLWLKQRASRVIDTTYLTPHELRKFVFENYAKEERRMKINLIAFGYAYGIPYEADLVFDVRFLPNPFFVESLKEKTGLNGEVAEFMESKDEFRNFFKIMLQFLLFLLPHYEKEGKSYLTIGFGCSGGKHRAPFIVKRLEDELRVRGYNVFTLFRDMER